MTAIPESNSGTAGPTGDLGGLMERERVPSARSELPVPLIAHSQRERILMSMTQSCASRGYDATSIGDVAGAAGVSRGTFYDLFRDKDECFRAAAEVALADTMGSIANAYSPDKPWAAMVRDVAAAFLRLLASRPALARLALVEAPSSGERGFEFYASGRRVLQALLDRGREDPVEDETIPSSAGRGALAAAESLIVGQILAGNTERLPRLLPDIVYIMTVPYLGQDEALRQSGEARKLV